MKRSKKLEPLVKVASMRETTAARELGKVQQRVADMQQKLEDLISYREQYAEGFETTSRNGINSVQLQDYQVFLARLDTAIKQQRQELSLVHKEYEHSRSMWVKSRGDAKAIDIVVEGHQRREAVELQRNEQRETDDSIRPAPRD